MITARAVPAVPAPHGDCTPAWAALRGHCGLDPSPAALLERLRP